MFDKPGSKKLRFHCAGRERQASSGKLCALRLILCACGTVGFGLVYCMLKCDKVFNNGKEPFQMLFQVATER